jgi:hypothetical protein
MWAVTGEATVKLSFGMSIDGDIPDIGDDVFNEVEEQLRQVLAQVIESSDGDATFTIVVTRSNVDVYNVIGR